LSAIAEAPRESTPDLSPADRLSRILHEEMGQVETLIADRMESPVGMIPDVADHLVSAGGKRLRPMIAVAAGRLLDYDGDGHLRLAAAVEFIHTATLLHDDVVDQSGLRRGREAANLVWGNSASVLVGDFLFARAFNLMVEAGSLDALNVLASASSTIAEGEVKQLAAIGDITLSPEDYTDIIESKTAALFAAAAEAPAVLAGANAEQRAAMATYGRELGLAFQLVDDALDYAGATAKLGKAVGDDFREGKITAPTAIAIAGADETEREFWRRTLSEVNQSDGDFARALDLVAKHDGVTRTLDMARERAERAEGALAVFKPGELRETLADLTRYLLQRAS